MKFIKVVCACVLLLASTKQAKSQGTQLLRQPSISDTQIVFVFANDLWIVDKAGGDARRLTSSEGEESYPHFSQDGQWIAFSGQYDGNTDVYLIPSAGGQPKRLTWHPGADLVTGWTPEGAVLFTSNREATPTKESKFFKITKEGGMEVPLAIPRAAFGELSEDGNYIAYQESSFWDAEWRNYRGGQAKPIWIVNMKDYSLQTTPRTDNERHTDPVWLNKIVYYLSERDFANNIWSYNPATKEEKQLTFHSDFDVKSLDAGGGVIVYEQGGYLHILNPTDRSTKQLIINVNGDFHWSRPRWENVKATSLQNASLSPTGVRALFEYRGEVFTVPKEKGDWRNITQSSGAADRFPIWSPDGTQIAWFSDTSGEYQLMISDQEGLTKPRAISLPNPTFYFKPQWSPDGKYIAYTDTDYNLMFVNVRTGEAKTVDTERYAHPNRSMNPVWSPDSKWIAYARLLDTQIKVIKVYNVETGQKIQVTDGMADAISPVWDASGKYLYFLASTNFALNTGWLDMSSYDRPVTRGVYTVVLSKNDSSPLTPQSDEEKTETAETVAPASATKNTKSKKEEEKPAGPKTTTQIDADGIFQRIMAIDIPMRDYTELIAGPENYLFYAENVPNQQGQTLHRYNFKDRKGEPFISPVQSISVSHDRKSLLYRNNGTWGIIATTEGPKKPGDGKLEELTSVKLKINPREEWKQIFREGWRYQRDFLYVNNVHGAPWNDIYKWYSTWVDHVQHREDLNYIVDILGGEVSVGHSFTRGGDFPDIEKVPVGLLGADYTIENGHYRFKKIYKGESWNPGSHAPLREPGLNIHTGDYLIAVNGNTVSATENLYAYFEGTADKQIKIRVNNKPGSEGSWLLTVVPVASEDQLRHYDWIETNRKKVDELSKGQLAYVYLPNTSNGGYEHFNRFYFTQQDKKGAIIDERNNGGGSAADYMVDIMDRKLQGYFNSNAGDHKPFTVPMAGIWGPKVMLINERAGSGGDLLPYLFHQMKIGKLVGTKTWGGLVGTWDTPLFIDGGRMVAPRGGYFNLNGEWDVEGVGISPDIEVIQSPADVINGHDPQLERAVQEALKSLEENPVELKPEPPAPVKWKRPVKK